MTLSVDVRPDTAAGHPPGKPRQFGRKPSVNGVLPDSPPLGLTWRDPHSYDGPTTPRAAATRQSDDGADGGAMVEGSMTQGAGQGPRRADAGRTTSARLPGARVTAIPTETRRPYRVRPGARSRARRPAPARTARGATRPPGATCRHRTGAHPPGAPVVIDRRPPHRRSDPGSPPTGRARCTSSATCTATSTSCSPRSRTRA